MRRAPTPKQKDLLSEQSVRALRALERQLGTVRFLDGVLIERVEITAGGEKRIRHGLKRATHGWWPTRVTGSPAELHETARDAESLTLQHEGASTTTFDVWIY